MSLSHSFAKLSHPKYLIPIAGVAVASIGLAYQYSTMSTAPISNEAKVTFKGDNEWVDLKLLKSEDLTHNTKHLTFKLNSEDELSGLVTASCLLTKFVTAKGNNVIRPYTPVSDTEQKGTIEFVVKKYEGGKMSSHIFDLKENETLSFKGPVVKWKWEPNQFKSISLIGGGTGITPLYQLLHEITKNPTDKTKVNLIFGNVSTDDILIKKEIDAIANAHKDQVKVTYFVDKAKEGEAWEGKVGYITKDFLASELDKPSSDTKVFVCGPPGLYKAVSGPKVSPTDQGELTGALAELGYTKEQVFKF
ncbi:NADH-cytochrome b5 reductase 2 [Spathaspora passalidarum NRRL Y-27907]|uniref:NADH-cytochrome b5 reductase n=1 Tax=Spathaspora passalidarum (strain NRRL Y-27907 / 11-Y1) TaxID=619300 RepID=G3AU58_SPAPN|nr:NADH-cytochrome b5 reductase 2 [Spathaspora passalidarum NRRL Y-27907]EGW30434.1 NADH-cytochrome b5 reductase 2 [Spathaspora passalidarum NRRL Y-27907]